MPTNDHLMTTYSPLPVTFESGEGCWLRDSRGNEYLDALSGIAVCGLGHAYPAVTRAIAEQAAKLVHTSNLYMIENQKKLADALCRLSGMERVFFSNSGAEANEAAIKMARMYGHGKGIKSPAIIVTEQSFHGRTMATLTATGNRKVQAGFEPLVQGFIRAPYDNIEAIENIARNSSNVVAVLVEPIQGEGGINIPAEGYLQELRRVCDENDWLLMLDEVQTGMGRTGKWFAFQHEGILPDVMTLAKSLGNGVPIGACLAGGRATDILKPGSHGSTFGGNPLACAAALAVIDAIEKNELVTRASRAGTRLLARLHETLDSCTNVVSIRGRGLMIGVELDVACAELVSMALQRGLLISVQNERTIRLLPPLIASDQELDEITDRLGRLVFDFVQQQAA